MRICVYVDPRLVYCSSTTTSSSTDRNSCIIRLPETPKEQFNTSAPKIYANLDQIGSESYDHGCRRRVEVSASDVRKPWGSVSYKPNL